MQNDEVIDREENAARRMMLRSIYSRTMQAMRVQDVLERAVQCEDGQLHVADLRYELAEMERIFVVAIGKAAAPSVEAVVRAMRSGLREGCSLRAIAVGPAPPELPAGEAEWWPGSHPLPDAGARVAAERMIELLKGAGPRDFVLFVISGGASAMVELPLDMNITVDETAEFYRALILSGLTIAEVNALRKHVSAVKGGRLAAVAAPAAQCTLLISDVPEGMPDVIGSGPTLADQSTREQCWALLRKPELSMRLPARVRAFLESAELRETPKQGDACFARSEYRVVLSGERMLREAARLCEEQGIYAVVDSSCDDWEYRRAAEYLLERLRELSEQHERVCVVSGGEVLVHVNAACGQGGRNQQFALYCANRLSEMAAEVTVMSAGTDGIDGNSPAAGAVVDGTTLERAQRAGFSVEEALGRFDSYPLLAGIGDAIVTGPSGNNLRDLRILMATKKQGSMRYIVEERR